MGNDKKRETTLAREHVTAQRHGGVLLAVLLMAPFLAQADATIVNQRCYPVNPDRSRRLGRRPGAGDRRLPDRLRGAIDHRRPAGYAATPRILFEDDCEGSPGCPTRRTVSALNRAIKSGTHVWA